VRATDRSDFLSNDVTPHCYARAMSIERIRDETVPLRYENAAFLCDQITFSSARSSTDSLSVSSLEKSGLIDGAIINASHQISLCQNRLIANRVDAIAMIVLENEKFEFLFEFVFELTR